MATGVRTWSTTAATNATADSSVNWAEGMAPSAVNDSARSEMASVAKFYGDINGTITAGGTTNALTVTTNQVVSTLANGDMVTFKTTAANTASSVTLAVDGLAAKPLRFKAATALPVGALRANSIYTATYNLADDSYLLHGHTGVLQIVAAGAVTQAATTYALSDYLNCASVSRTGVGTVTVTFTNAIPSGALAMIYPGGLQHVVVVSLSTTSLSVAVKSPENVAEEGPFNFVIYSAY